ncbi:MAG: TonB-dependent receptor [Gemmatimonadota bacterium]|nr:TonB-dependent receptor [Gemmatimonadota bacterium]
MDTLLVTGRMPLLERRDPVADPRIESAGLEPSISIVGKDQFTRQGAGTVIEALEYIPGARVETRGRKVKQFFSIRGQSYPYPGYAIDGAWQREFHELPYFFSSEDVERIEVMRSSAALLTGPSGMAGIVNIVPRRFSQPETSLRIEYGSFGTSRLHLAHGGTAGDLEYALSLGMPRADGPEHRHASEGMTHLRWGSTWQPNEQWRVSTHFLHLSGSRELARAEPPAALIFRNTLEKFDPFRAALACVKTFYRPSDKTSTELIVNWAGRDHEFINENASGHVSFRERDTEWGLNLTQSLKLRKDNVLRLGGLYNRWVAPDGKRFYTGRRCDLETFSWVAVDEHDFGRLKLDAGLRWTKTHINEYGAFNINGVPKGFKEVASIHDEWESATVTVSFGGAYLCSQNLSLHLNLSAGSVKPRAGDLDDNLERLSVERRVKLDLGIQVRRNGLGRLEATCFLVDRKDAIVLSGSTGTLNGRVMELYLNRNQEQLGLEVDARSAPLPGGVRAFLNLLALDSRAESGAGMVRNRELPRFITSGGLYGTWREDLDFSLLLKAVSGYESTRFVAGAGGNPLVPQPLGGYLNLDTIVGYSFGSRPRTRVYLEVRNLADRRFSTVVGYPDYGRRFTLGLRSTLQ